MSADRNLLLGILALQLDFISRDQLIAGMQAWVNDKGKPLAQILEAAGALDATNRQLLEPLVARHIQQHANDPQQSLAAVRAASSVKHDLQVIRDEDLQASLPIVGAANASEADDVFATLSAGQATSDGLRFRIVRKYREGGLGIVSVAQDSELDREVALKEMKPQFADDPSGRVRFVREAEITGGLEHPNIVPVYGLGAHDDGRPFYAMRLIRGDTSLADEIKSFHAASKNPYAAEQNLRLRGLLQRFIAVCDAIEYAHSRGVLHRDLKPANIMLGKFGETLVVDWGLAKLLKREGDPDQTWNVGKEPILKSRSSDSDDETSMGSAIGTPQFMSPEQAQGRLDLLSPATDVYGLGATLYALLTGLAPVDGKSSEEVLTQVRKGELVPARSRLRSVPAALDAICAKAMSFEQAERYGSAKALATEIAAYLADEPVTAYREPLTVRARRWTRKHPAIVSGGLASALVTILGLLIGFALLGHKNRELSAANTRETNQRLRAEQGEKEARENEAIANAVKDFLLYDLLHLATPDAQADVGIPLDPNVKVWELLLRGRDSLTAGELQNQPEARAEVREILDEGLHSVDAALTVTESVRSAAAAIEERFRDQPLIEAEIRHVLGSALRSTGEFMLAITHCLRASELYRQHRGPNDPDTLTTVSSLAIAYAAAGYLDKALPLFEETHRLRRATLGIEHLDTLSSMYNLAIAFEDAGRLAEALSLKEETLRLRKAKLGPDHPDTLSSMDSLAVAYKLSGRLDEALPLLEETLRLRKAKLDPDHPDTLGSMNNLALAYSDVGRLDEALSLYKETHKLMGAKLGPEHPLTLNSLNGLAVAYDAVGRLDEALPLYVETLRLRKAKLGPTHPSTLDSMGNLATAYVAVGRLEEAVPLFEETHKLSKAQLGAEHPRTLLTMNNLALAYDGVGRLDESLKLHEETLQLRKAKLGPEHPDTLTSMDGLANAYRAAGQLDAALRLHEETHRLSKLKLGPEHPDTLRSMNNLANAYGDAGRLDEALKLHDETLQVRKAKLGPEHPDTLSSIGNLAVAYEAVGRLAEALLLYEQTYKLMKSKLGPEHPDTLKSMSGLAGAYDAAGRLDEALPLYEETLRLCRAKLGPEHPDTLYAMNDLAWFLASASDVKRRDPARALELAQAAVAASPKSADYRGTLGAVRYRASAWTEATADLRAAIDLRVPDDNANAYEAFFLAMAHWQLGKKDEARAWFSKAVKWMEQGSPPDAELKRFRAEAEQLIGEPAMP